jgi:L-seryl-tRNA(Ser) seleniumtransferase
LLNSPGKEFDMPKKKQKAENLDSAKNIFSAIPSIDLLLSQPKAAELMRSTSRWLVRDVIREVIAEFKQHLQKQTGTPPGEQEIISQIIAKTEQKIAKLFQPSLQRVINATGIVLHTSLGRAPFSTAAQENVIKIMRGYCNLEIELETGKRGQRNDHVINILCRLTGAESAAVANNNAAAVFLALNSMAFGKEAIISRGQLVEIGGSFRMPDVMEKSGVIMREVGTTNKTRLEDYENAINDNTGMIVVAHTSNYRVLGFTEEVDLTELVRQAHKHHIPLLHDLGGGVLVDLHKWGLPYEPLVQDSIKAGTDVITFSGDKVIGGPQSGILVGRKEWIKKITANPIMRAMRCDKLIYSALEATLKLFFMDEKFLENHQTMRMLTEPQAVVEARCHKLLNALKPATVQRWNITVEPSFAQTGSGALPLEQIPSSAVVLNPDPAELEELAKKLRQYDPPVMGYIKKDKIFLDLRTVTDEELCELVEALQRIKTEGRKPDSGILST